MPASLPSYAFTFSIADASDAPIKAPTLWLIGASDASAMENVKAYEGKLAGTKVTLKLLNGTTYGDSFGKSELSRAEAVPFLTTAR